MPVVFFKAVVVKRVLWGFWEIGSWWDWECHLEGLSEKRVKH